LEESGWFGGMLEEFVRENTVPDEKNKRIKLGLRARERGQRKVTGHHPEVGQH